MLTSTTGAKALPPLTVVNGLPGYQFGERFVPTMAGAEDDPPKADDPPKPADDPKDEDFDKDRALATIRKLRENEKTAKATAKQLEDAQARIREIEDKDKSAGDKAISDLDAVSKKLAAAEAATAASEARYQAAQIRAAIDREAHKANAVDADAVAALLDRSGVAIDADGNVTGADKAVAALLKAKPYLLAAEGSPGGASARSIPGSPKPNGRPSPTDKTQADIDSLRATGRYSV